MILTRYTAGTSPVVIPLPAFSNQQVSGRFEQVGISNIHFIKYCNMYSKNVDWNKIQRLTEEYTSTITRRPMWCRKNPTWLLVLFQRRYIQYNYMFYTLILLFYETSDTLCDLLKIYTLLQYLLIRWSTSSISWKWKRDVYVSHYTGFSPTGWVHVHTRRCE